jgi:hypothetical protein
VHERFAASQMIDAVEREYRRVLAGADRPGAVAA